MNRLLSLRILLFLMVIAFNACAQPGSMGYMTKDKKAIKEYEKAIAAYRNIDPRTGRPNFKLVDSYIDNALKRDARFVDAIMLKSRIYQDQGQLDEAADWLKKGIETHPQLAQSEIYFLAELEWQIGRYEDCKKHATEFLKLPRTRTNPDLQRNAEWMIMSCEFAINSKKNPVAYSPINLGPGVNTENGEYFPAITGDDQMLLFTRLLPEPKAYGGLQEDFFYSIKQPDGTWGTAKSISNRINTLYNEGAPTLSADGRTMIFAACALEDGYGAGRTGEGSCDLFITKKEGNEWVVARNLGLPINSFHWETQPSISADGKTLYFIRGLTRVNGQRVARYRGDIYMSTLGDDGRWAEPTRLPDYINTPGSEASVHIHPDGQTLYFASDGHIGMGGQDLYMCRKQPDGSWGKPINLGYPINTENDENSLLVSSAGDIAFFASNRPGGYGDLDLYSFELPKHLRPVTTLYMKGIVYNIIDKSPLGAQFELIDLATGTVAFKSQSSAVNGEFLVSLPTGKDYALNVTKDGFLYWSKNFTLIGGTADKPFLMDVPLTPIGDVAKTNAVVLENIFFDVDKFDLKPESKIELNKLVDFLKKNPTIHIELRGHTDSDGDDKQNLVLSDNRAKAVMNYLVTGGIDKKRLAAKGFGETVPIAPNDTPQNKAKNRRTEYIITAF